jgi:hypothetical protein
MPTPDACPTLTEEDTAAHPITKTLQKLISVKDVKVSVSKMFWPRASNFEDLPEVVTGVLKRWVNKAQYKLSIEYVKSLAYKELCQRHSQMTQSALACLMCDRNRTVYRI